MIPPPEEKVMKLWLRGGLTYRYPVFPHPGVNLGQVGEELGPAHELAEPRQVENLPGLGQGFNRRYVNKGQQGEAGSARISSIQLRTASR